MSYEKLLREQIELKERASLDSLPKNEVVSFGGINLHENLDLSLFSNEKILLAHSCIHTLFSKKNRFTDEKRVSEIHNKVVKEMNKRNLSHEKFDKLD